MYRKHLLKLLGFILAAVGAMGGFASAAQAKYVLLLNGVPVNSLTLTAEFLSGYATIDNGFKIQCSGGTGLAKAELAEGGKKVSFTMSGALAGCVWVGGEKICIINDEGVGKIKVSGSGEIVMADANTYTATASSPAFLTVYSEGAFCGLQEELSAGGTVSAVFSNALEATAMKSAQLHADDLRFGEAKVTALVGQMHFRHENPNSTFGIHLVDL